jgi:hypothetical protein
MAAGGEILGSAEISDEALAVGSGDGSGANVGSAEPPGADGTPAARVGRGEAVGS